MADFASPNPGFSVQRELALDEVFYAAIAQGNREWRVGATRADWAAELGRLLAEGADQEKLAASGIWLGRADERARCCLMCCGLGSVWPHMGRQLYADFPVARKAMDYIASFANWDLPGLMDEPDLDVISQSRWQIPYLFMLEYAQWRQFYSLGLRPMVVCGHSLGELIALCVAGVYDARAAWLLLETRARHMEALEAASDRQGGMLAAPADEAEIQEILARWPELGISNRNTRKQFILGGRRDKLLEARRYLRKKRIPAVMLNMDLAFHNPAMRVLRDISVLRMNFLQMGPPAGGATMLSCVTGDKYPYDTAAICEAIADLDENTVDWVKLIEAIGRDYGVNLFLELGPQETLGGITAELAADATIVASDHKNREAEATRAACARLYAAGLLDDRAIRRRIRQARRDGLFCANSPLAYVPAKNEAFEAGEAVAEADRDLIMRLLAEACHKPASEISPEMDLRADLSLRSATFPYLMMEAEARLGRPIRFENLFQIATVADLIRFLAGSGGKAARREKGIRKEYSISRASPDRYLPDGEGGFLAAPFNPALAQEPDGDILVRVYDEALARDAMGGLASRGWRMGVPGRAGTDRPEWEDWKTCHWQYDPGFFATAGANENSESARWPLAGVIFSAPPEIIGESVTDRAVWERRAEECAQVAANGWLLIIQRFIAPEGIEWRGRIGEWLAEMKRRFGGRDFKFRAIAWLAPEIPGRNFEAGDMLAREINYGREPAIIWNSVRRAGQAPRFCPASGYYGALRPANFLPAGEDGAIFQGECQFSLFSQPDLATHGAGAAFTPLAQSESQFKSAAWLPLSAILKAMHGAASVTAPWLAARGYQDLHVSGFPAIPPGITRECRLGASSHIELPLAHVMARVCGVKMSIADLAATGRKNGAWLALASCAFLLARENPDISKIWRFDPDLAPDPATAVYPESLYEAMALGEDWRPISALATGEKAGDACSALIAQDCASADIWDRVFRLADAAQLAALAGLALPGAPGQEELAARLGEWRFAGIGFASFDTALLESVDTLLLRLFPAWNSGRLARYHGYIATQDNKFAMTFHNLEFERVKKDQSAAD